MSAARVLPPEVAQWWREALEQHTPEQASFAVLAFRASQRFPERDAAADGQVACYDFAHALAGV